MSKKIAYRLTGFVILVLGILFFLRDIGVNFIGNTSGWTILIVLAGVGLLAGHAEFIKAAESKSSKAKAKMSM